MIQGLKGTTYRMGASPQRALLGREGVSVQDCGELAERQGVVELSEETDEPITGFGDASQPEATSRGGHGRRRIARWRPVPCSALRPWCRSGTCVLVVHVQAVPSR